MGRNNSIGDVVKPLYLFEYLLMESTMEIEGEVIHNERNDDDDDDDCVSVASESTTTSTMYESEDDEDAIRTAEDKNKDMLSNLLTGRQSSIAATLDTPSAPISFDTTPKKSTKKRGAAKGDGNGDAKPLSASDFVKAIEDYPTAKRFVLSDGVITVPSSSTTEPQSTSEEGTLDLQIITTFRSLLPPEIGNNEALWIEVKILSAKTISEMLDKVSALQPPKDEASESQDPLDLMLGAYSFDTNKYPQIKKVTTSLNLKLDQMQRLKEEKSNLHALQIAKISLKTRAIKQTRKDVIILRNQLKTEQINAIKTEENDRINKLTEDLREKEMLAQEMIVRQFAFLQAFDHASLISSEIAVEYENCKKNCDEKTERATLKYSKAKYVKDQRKADKTASKAQHWKDAADKCKALLDFASFREAVKKEDLLIQEILTDEAFLKTNIWKNLQFMAEIHQFETLTSLENAKTLLAERTKSLKPFSPKKSTQSLVEEEGASLETLNQEVTRLKTAYDHANQLTAMEITRLQRITMKTVSGAPPLPENSIAIVENNLLLFKDEAYNSIRQYRQIIIEEAQELSSLPPAQKQCEINRREAIRKEFKAIQREKIASLEAQDAAKRHKKAEEYVPVAERRLKQAEEDVEKQAEDAEFRKEFAENAKGVAETVAKTQVVPGAKTMARVVHATSAVVSVYSTGEKYYCQHKVSKAKEDLEEAIKEVPRLLLIKEEKVKIAKELYRELLQIQHVTDKACYIVESQTRQKSYEIQQQEMKKCQALKKVYEAECQLFQDIVRRCDQHKGTLSFFDRKGRSEATKALALATNHFNRGKRIVEAISNRVEQVSNALKHEMTRETRFEKGPPPDELPLLKEDEEDEEEKLLSLSVIVN
jgi:hypothetical protein